MENWKRNGRCNVYKYLSYIWLMSLGSILGLCMIIIKNQKSKNKKRGFKPFGVLS